MINRCREKLYAIGAHSSKRAGACQIDPEAHTITNYGAIGPSHAPDNCWGYSGAADDRYIYIVSGKVPWYLVCFDRETGEDTTLFETETVLIKYHGVCVALTVR